MKRKNKGLYVVLIVLILFGISIGYAVINRTLNITGNSEVKQNTWDLHFDNVKVTSGSVSSDEAPVINNGNLSVNFNFMLNLPGDFYEFTIDVVNRGSIDAMIDSIEKTPNLTDEQKKYMSYIIEYENSEQISVNQLVKAGEEVKLKVRVEYRSDVSEADLPTSNITTNLGCSVTFVQADKNAGNVKNNGAKKSAIANGDVDEIGTIVTIGTEQFYTVGTDGDNVKLLAMYNLYVGGDYIDGVWYEYGDEATGMQDANMIGIKSNSNYDRKGVVPFSSVSLGDSSLSYSGSYVEQYTNNYKNILETKFGINVVEARSITYDELTSKEIKCTNSCLKTYSWIYSSSYYTQSINYMYRPAGVTSYGALIYTEYYYSYGVRPVIVLSRGDIEFENNLTIATFGDISKMGTIVRIESEQFYSIGIVDDNVELLAMYNLNVGNIVYEDGNIIPIVTSVVKQNSKALGFNPDGYPYVGTVEFANDTYKGISYSDYSGSLMEKYINDYVNLFENEFGVTVSNVKFIDMGDILGQEFSGYSNILYMTSYWLRVRSSDEFIYTIKRGGSYNAISYNVNNAYGIRPIMVISKDYF